ncbi:MAG TPA: DNA polymerase III subunit delta' [Thermaerobacter sp.]
MSGRDATSISDGDNSRAPATAGQAAERVLRDAVRTGRVSHAYLLAGPAGAGHREAAREMAAALLCQRPVAGGPCGGCDACARVEAGAHPDLIVPDRHGIDAVRQVIGELAYRPREAARKVVLWYDIDRLTPQAANALLKSLEEPPPYITFLLTTDRPQGILPTLRSRCQVLPFRPRPREERARELAARAGADPLAAYWALRVAGDDARAAADLLADPATAHEAAALREAARRLRDGTPADALEVARTLAGLEDRAEAAAEVLVLLLRGEDPGGRGGEGEATGGEPVSPEARVAWSGALAGLRQAWQANANRLLALEVFCWRCWQGCRRATAG